MIVYITREPIHLEKFFSLIPERSCGALTSFVGIVRNHDHGRPVRKLFYECYASMAERVIENVVREAAARWPVEGIRILHRIGELEIGDAAVAVAVGAAHRQEAFDACRFLIERIKHEVPIWKKQYFEDGTSEWTFCSHLEGVRG